MNHRLKMRHTDRVRALELSFVDRNNAAADDFRHVCAGIDRYDYDSRRNKRQRTSAACECVTPVDNHRLNHHRRTAENLDVRVENKVGDLLQNSYGFMLRYGYRAETPINSPINSPMSVPTKASNKV